MKNEKTYRRYWYSRKQRDFRDSLGYEIVVYAMINGKEVEYTACAEVGRCEANEPYWDDTVFLGVGTYSRYVINNSKPQGGRHEETTDRGAAGADPDRLRASD